MKNSLLKSGSRLSGLTLVSRVLGLLRETTKAAFLGTTALSDAFSVAFIIPNLLRRLFAEGSISVAFIPTFKEYLERRDAEETRRFLSATFTLITFLTTVTVGLGMIITPWILPFFGTLSDESVLLTRIMFPYLAIISVAAFFQGILNGVKVFSPSGFTPILFNIFVIGSAWLLSPHMANPARAMSIGILLGGFSQAAFQLPFVVKEGFRFSLVPIARAFADPGTKKVLRLIGPTIIGMAAYQFNDIVSSALAGRTGVGILSSLQYSLRLQELILGIFAVSIGTVILPDLSGHAAKKEWEPFSAILLNAVNTITLISIPVTFFSLVAGEDIITLVYKNRSFSDESVALTLDAFRWHIAGLLCIALNRVISPAFYAQSDTKSPTMAGIASFGVNILLAFLLAGPMRGGGIAMALSLASLVNTVLLLALMGKSKTVDVRRMTMSLLGYAAKIAVFSAVASLPLIFFRDGIYAYFTGKGRLIGTALPLSIELAVFSGLGLALLALTKDTAVSAILKKISGRGSVK